MLGSREGENPLDLDPKGSFNRPSLTWSTQVEWFFGFYMIEGFFMAIFVHSFARLKE